jgi:hypothetical protein
MAFDMGAGAGGIIGGVFSYLGSREQAKTAKSIADKQMQALERMRRELYTELDPANVNAQAKGADVDRTLNSLGMQGKVDPKLLATRYTAAENILNALNQPTGDAEALAGQLMTELQPGGAAEMLKTQLIDQAISEIEMGAELPGEIQQELVKTGLERAAQSGLGTSGDGAAADLVRRSIVGGALALQNQRQEKAAKLSESAIQLANQRAQILGNIFPNLKALQSETIKQAGAGLDMSTKNLPNVGLAGTDIANLLMARVGASNTLTGNESAALGDLGKGLGAATAAGYGALGGVASGVADTVWNNVYKK